MLYNKMHVQEHIYCTLYRADRDTVFNRWLHRVNQYIANLKSLYVTYQ